MDTSQQIADWLLRIQALSFRPKSPYTWASGWKSPVYCDNRLTLSYPDIRTGIAEAFAEAIRSAFPEASGVAGVATAGIPHATLAGHLLNLPLAYVRSQPKSHGKGNQIEGQLVPDSLVVVIEDLVSTGGSSLQAVDALRQEGYRVAGLVSVFTYGFPVAEQRFADADLTAISLCNLQVLGERAVESGYVSAADWERVTEWRKNPADWQG